MERSLLTYKITKTLPTRKDALVLGILAMNWTGQPEGRANVLRLGPREWRVSFWVRDLDMPKVRELLGEKFGRETFTTAGVG
jgi:hypothetical protein